jgi:hypothetical protein
VIRSVDIAWLTGLLEGEGHFCMSGRSILIVVNMTDRDVIERAATLMGGYVYALPSASPRHKPQWRAQLKGPRAAGWMMTMYAWLGTRRRGQVEGALSRWRAMPYVRISPQIERSIVEAWETGATNKSALARRFGVSRNTVYDVLVRSGDLRVKEPHRLTAIDVAWLAGLVEGEGNVGISGRSMTIRVKMSDHDVILRAAELLEGKVYPVPAPDGWKPQWLTEVKGSLAAAWSMTLYPWLGVRRRQQVRDGLAHWRRQGNGVIGPALAEAIVGYRAARVSQVDIMRLLRIGKSTVYRHTRGRLPRLRVTKRQLAPCPASPVRCS